MRSAVDTTSQYWLLITVGWCWWWLQSNPRDYWGLWVRQRDDN